MSWFLQENKPTETHTNQRVDCSTDFLCTPEKRNTLCLPWGWHCFQKAFLGKIWHSEGLAWSKCSEDNQLGIRQCHYHTLSVARLQRFILRKHWGHLEQVADVLCEWDSHIHSLTAGADTNTLPADPGSPPRQPPSA